MTRRAVIIGSNGPKIGDIKLKYAQDDAKRIAAALLHPRCGFEVELLAEPKDPWDIRQAVERMARACGPEDTLVFFFAGHGLPEEGTLLLFLQNSKLDDPFTALHADDLVRAMRFSRAQHKLLIFDCCHAGMVFNDSQWRDVPLPKMDTIVQGLPDEGGGASFVALLASDRLQRARELSKLKGGFLSHWLCEALGDSMPRADNNHDGAIDLSDVKKWLESCAQEHNRKDETSRVPVPFFYGRERGTLYLTLEPKIWQPKLLRIDGLDFALLPLKAEDDRLWCIGKTPVTNAQYKKFAKATGHREPTGQAWKSAGGEDGEWIAPFAPWADRSFSSDQKPVVCVDADDVLTYCDWLSFGSEEHDYIPTPVDVWDFAAFNVPYPDYDRRTWSQKVIYDRQPCPASVSDAKSVERVGRFGTVDLLGNVWEWCSSKTSKRSHSIEELRGGSFLDDLNDERPTALVEQIYGNENCRHSDLGFRVATTIERSSIPDEVWARARAIKDYE